MKKLNISKKKLFSFFFSPLIGVGINLGIGLFSMSTYARVADSLERFQWGNVEVILIEDNRYPKYELAIYFGDGSLGDIRLPSSTSKNTAATVD